jgi:hypothetical protein
MCQINERDGGDTVAIFQLDPYQFDMKADRPGLRTVLEEKKDLQQMVAEPSDDPNSTSLETYVDASPEFRLNSIATAVHPGHTVVEVKDTDADTDGTAGLSISECTKLLIKVAIYPPSAINIVPIFYT